MMPLLIDDALMKRSMTITDAISRALRFSLATQYYHNIITRLLLLRKCLVLQAQRATYLLRYHCHASY